MLKNDKSIKFILENKNKPYILDGAIGSYLEQKFPDENNESVWMIV
jgi:hypothetical protein